MQKRSIRITAALLAIATVASLSGGAVIASDITKPAVSSTVDETVYPEITEGTFKDGAVTVYFKKVNGAAKYNVYSKADNGEFEKVGSVKKTAFTSKNVKEGHTYTFKIVAESSTGKTSAASELISFDVKNNGDAEITIYDEPTDYGVRQHDRKEKRRDWLVGDTYGEYEEDAMYEESAEYYDYEPEVTTAAVPATYAVSESSPKTENGTEENQMYYYDGNDAETLTAGTLTAGVLYDSRDYSDFVNYVKKLDKKKDQSNNDDHWVSFVSAESEYLFDWTNALDRYTITVTNGKENIEGAKVEYLDGNGKAIFTAISDNKGKAYIYPGMADGKGEKIRITSPDGKQDVVKELAGMKQTGLKVTLPDAVNAPKKLDIMFMVDTTGSMSDELKYLQVEIDDVIGRIGKDNGDLPIRTSVNFYRDEGDDYVVRTYPFRNNVKIVQDSLSDQSAHGGGDYPEAVHTALDKAINSHAWCEDSTKIMFLVLDAPPHKEKSEEYLKAISQCAEQGIRLIPVASSGVDEGTEYILRSSALITGGKYVFLTDDSGVGLSHKKPSADSYAVKKLNDIMVKLVSEYLE